LRGEAVKIEKYKGGRNWGLYDEKGALIAVIVYKKGASEVMRRLLEKQEEGNKNGGPSQSDGRAA
jgi:hypothetical protein